MKIKDMKEFERPRERLKEYGSFSLSNDELLAILLNKGTKNKSAKELGLEVLNSVNKISDLKDITIEKLTNIKGIGQAGAITILSAIELGKRIFNNKNYNKKIVLKTADEIYQYIKYELFDKKQEYFYCLYVNSKKELIERKLLFMGTLNRSTVHPREIFKNAYLNSASGIICIHNHPSGDVTPSMEDKILTNNLVELGMMNGISLVDHIIVSNDNYYSFFNDGKIINL